MIAIKGLHFWEGLATLGEARTRERRQRRDESGDGGKVGGWIEVAGVSISLCVIVCLVFVLLFVGVWFLWTDGGVQVG